LNVYAKRCATQAGIDLGGLPSIGALCSPRKSFNFRQQTLEPTEVSFNYFCRLPRRSRSTEVEVPYGSVLNSCCVCCFSTLISSVERVEQKWSLTFSPHPWIPPQLQSSPLFATGVSTTCSLQVGGDLAESPPESTHAGLSPMWTLAPVHLDSLWLAGEPIQLPQSSKKNS
jgi:hypothetical protein